MQHPLRDINAALRPYFELGDPVPGAYLHRWELPAGLRQAEVDLIADGLLPAVGARQIARRRTEDPSLVEREGPELSILGLDHGQIAAPAGCEPQARRFFGELLGLLEIDKPEALRQRGGVWFAVGAQQLHVGVQEPFSPARKAHIALTVAPDDLDALAGRLTASGAPVVWDDLLPQTRRFHSEDPWGNRIELLAHLP